jgi:hypothetical protein
MRHSHGIDASGRSQDCDRSHSRERICGDDDMSDRPRTDSSDTKRAGQHRRHPANGPSVSAVMHEEHRPPPLPVVAAVNRRSLQTRCRCPLGLAGATTQSCLRSPRLPPRAGPSRPLQGSVRPTSQPHSCRYPNGRSAMTPLPASRRTRAATHTARRPPRVDSRTEPSRLSEERRHCSATYVRRSPHPRRRQQGRASRRRSSYAPDWLVQMPGAVIYPFKCGQRRHVPRLSAEASRRDSRQPAALSAHLRGPKSSAERAVTSRDMRVQTEPTMTYKL